MLAHAHVCIHILICSCYDLNYPSSVIQKACNSSTATTTYLAAIYLSKHPQANITYVFISPFFQEIWFTYKPTNAYVVARYNAQVPVTAYLFKDWVENKCNLMTRGCTYNMRRTSWLPHGSHTSEGLPSHICNVILWWIETCAPLLSFQNLLKQLYTKHLLTEHVGIVSLCDTPLEILLGSYKPC